ncbi:hypothetical protein ACFTUC_29995 [Streptomyces sp. NPDC056944]|uniref:hypothetical protein n=1 Tax=Streptomyces sp. NPDC056944 TaxID=3345972 RepID=UPI003628AA0A
MRISRRRYLRPSPLAATFAVPIAAGYSWSWRDRQYDGAFATSPRSRSLIRTSTVHRLVPAVSAGREGVGSRARAGRGEVNRSGVLSLFVRDTPDGALRALTSPGEHARQDWEAAR